MKLYFDLFSPLAGWAFPFCTAKKGNKNARKLKLAPLKQ